MQSGGDSSVKDMMQKLAAKFEDKWDVSKNNNFNEQWDINMNDVATKFKDKWDIHKKKKLAPQGDVVAANNGEIADVAQSKERRSVDKDNNIAATRPSGGLKSSETPSKSSNRTFGSPTADNPYILRSVPCSQSGLEE